MNTRIILFGMLFLLSGLCSYGSKIDSKNLPVPKGQFKLYAEPDLYSLSKTWVDRFSSENSSQTIELIQSEISEISRGTEGENKLYVLSDFQSHDLLKAFSWKMILGQEVLVTIMNANNPAGGIIRTNGVSMNSLKKMATSPTRTNWAELLPDGANVPLRIYTSDNQFVVETLTRLTGGNLSAETSVVSPEELIRKVQGDKNAIGFCTLSSLSKAGSEKMPEGISIMPIDKNGNGQIDYMESIYGDLQSFSRGVWIGKYPKALSNTIYAAANEKPASPDEVAFLKWLITDGQQVLDESGYSEIVYTGRLSQLAKFESPNALASVPIEKTSSLLGLFLAIIFGIVAMGVFLELFYFRAKKKSFKAGHSATSVAPFDLRELDMPQGYYFDKTHTWAFLRKNGTVKIGINDFMMHLTGEISKVEMKSIGEKIKKGDAVCSIVNKGRVLSFYSPISGTITECNKNLNNSPSSLKKSPYAEGWVYVVQPLNWSLESQYLTLGEVYKNWISKEFTRLMDFVTKSIKGGDSREFSPVILQDGGLLKDNFLDDLEPKIWEDFQTKFIDTSK